MPYHEISPTVRINYTIHPPTHPAGITAKKPWIILINGLADPQTTWAAQIPSFTAAGYNVFSYDNRGVGLSSRAAGEGEAWTAATMASDLRSLVRALEIPTPYHVMGVSMGGMIAQRYALDYCCCGGSTGDGGESGGELLSLTLACTYAAPGPFCSRMFALWQDMAARMSIADVMHDVALWAFTPAFFADPARADEVADMERDMKNIDADMGLHSYLAQLNVITSFDTRDEVARLGHEKGLKVVVLAGEEDILIPVALSRELCTLVGDGAVWRTTRGGHACMWEFPERFNEACLQGWREVEEKR